MPTRKRRDTSTHRDRDQEGDMTWEEARVTPSQLATFVLINS